MKEVLLLQRRLPRYRVPLFERMRETLAARGVAFTVAHGDPGAAERARGDEGALPWAVRLGNRSLRAGGTLLTWQPVPRALLDRQDLVIMPHEGGMLYNHLLLARHRRGALRLAFFGHGDNLQAGARRSLRGLVKRAQSRRVDWWFAYTALSARLVAEHGFPGERVTQVDNAVDTAGLARAAAGIDPGERERLRAGLGLAGTRVGIFIGSLHHDKRVPLLLAAADALRDRTGDFELIVVGDGPLREEVRRFAAARPWVRWVGARFDREKALHASLAAVLLNPGLVGLVILDSFALGVPLVTTDCRLHSPEIAYLEPGRNGVMTEDSLAAFVAGAAGLLEDGGARGRMAGECRRDAARYTLEGMCERFCAGIGRALEAPRNAGAGPGGAVR